MGREQTDLQEGWDDESLRREISRLEQTDKDVFMIHSWHVSALPTQRRKDRKINRHSIFVRLFRHFRKRGAERRTVSRVDQSARQRPRQFIEQAIEIFKQRGGRVIVEIGIMRQPLTHPIEESGHACCNDGHSSILWARTGAELYCVDYDPACVKTTREEMARHGFAGVTTLRDDGIRFLAGFNRPIDLLYLDAWDADLPDSAAKHLEAYRTARPSLRCSSIILIDDTDVELVGNELVLNGTGQGGKGRLVIPETQLDGYRIVASGRQTLLVRD